MKMFNNDLIAFNDSVKIIGRIPIEFNKELDYHLRTKYNLFLIEDEDYNLRFAIEYNKTCLDSIVKTDADVPDMEEAQDDSL